MRRGANRPDNPSSPDFKGRLQVRQKNTDSADVRVMGAGPIPNFNGTGPARDYFAAVRLPPASFAQAPLGR
jgi:hypothetical protein